MTDWAAKVLEGVPRAECWELDPDAMRPSNDGDWVRWTDALAAIARMGAGDGLAERLLARKGRGGGFKHDVEDGVNVLTHEPAPDPLCQEAAAHIAALTAQNREMALDVLASSGQAAEAYAAQLAAEAERDALRAKVAENRISEPHDPGDFVGDIFYGHPIKTTMGTHRWTGTEWVALPSEAEALAGLLAEARKEAAALRAKVARLEGAGDFARLIGNDAGKDDKDTVLVSYGMLRRLRAALTDGGKDG